MEARPIRSTLRPVQPYLRTSWWQAWHGQRVSNPNSCTAANGILFDHLVSAGKHCWRHGDPERFAVLTLTTSANLSTAPEANWPVLHLQDRVDMWSGKTVHGRAPREGWSTHPVSRTVGVTFSSTLLSSRRRPPPCAKYLRRSSGLSMQASDRSSSSAFALLDPRSLA